MDPIRLQRGVLKRYSCLVKRVKVVFHENQIHNLQHRQNEKERKRKRRREEKKKRRCTCRPDLWQTFVVKYFTPDVYVSGSACANENTYEYSIYAWLAGWWQNSLAQTKLTLRHTHKHKHIWAHTHSFTFKYIYSTHSTGCVKIFRFEKRKICNSFAKKNISYSTIYIYIFCSASSDFHSPNTNMQTDRLHVQLQYCKQTFTKLNSSSSMFSFQCW